MRDLIVLAADNQAKATLSGLLENRRRSLGIREIDYELIVHLKRDPGCFQTSHDLLRSQATRYSRCIVIFDYEGCGRDHRMSPDDVSADVLSRLLSNGWSAGEACVIVIVPELEAWVWSNSPHVAKEIAGLRTINEVSKMLRTAGFLNDEEERPSRPKEAMEFILKQTGKPNSSSVFRTLAEKVSLTNCEDPAFLALSNQLRAWFPAK